MGILTRILAEKAQEITALKREKFVVEPRSRSAASWVESLRRPASHPLHLLAEIKQKSPSAGMLSSALTKVQRGLVYAECGASMVGVLCDGPFFGGSYGDLRDVRNALRLAGRETPVLAKEFVLHTVQIDAAAAHGADAVLLIVRILAEGALWELLEHARSRGIEPLVEVATEPELETALRAGARVIGVNARDLEIGRAHV